MLNESATNCSSLIAVEPPPLYSKTIRYILVSVLCLFPVITVVGNILVVVAVATHKRLQTITNAFVVSLAIADVTVAILVMPFGIYQQFSNKQWGLGHTLCVVTLSFDVMFTTCSIVHLSCLAVDRYLAICRPFVHERITNRIVAGMLALCWVMPIFISFMPIINGWNLLGIEHFNECLFPEGTCGLLVNTGFALVCSTIAFYLPTILMIISNIKMFQAAEKQAKSIAQQANQVLSIDETDHKKKKRKLRKETKAAKTIGIIMGCFCVCWFPFFILNVIDPLIGYKIPYVPWTVALWLGYVNSLLNPFLYYNFNRGFRRAFQRLLMLKTCRGISEYHDEYINTRKASDISTRSSYNFSPNSPSSATDFTQLTDFHHLHPNYKQSF